MNYLNVGTKVKYEHQNKNRTGKIKAVVASGHSIVYAVKERITRKIHHLWIVEGSVYNPKIEKRV